MSREPLDATGRHLRCRPITGESSGNLTTNLGVRNSNLFGRAITIKTHMFWD
jgi:hypothetical protein